jgi:hypothetical protein
MNQYQIFTAQIIADGQVIYYTAAAAGAIGSSALVASRTEYDIDQAALPNNQWTIEVSSWFGISLVALQRFVVDYASGPSDFDPTSGGQILNNGDAVTKSLCKNQKIRSNGEYQNFSVPGLVVIFLFGIIIILASLSRQLGHSSAKGNRARVPPKKGFSGLQT